MADPRADNAFDGIGELPVTFKHDGSIVFNPLLPGGSAQVGRAVYVVAARTVGLTIDGVGVKGRLEKVEHDGFCGVVVDGYVKLPSRTGAIPAVGSQIVGALGGAGNAEPGFIRAAAAPGAAYGEGAADDSAAARGQVVDNTNGAAVVVEL